MSARSVDVLLARAAVRAAVTRTRTSAVGQPDELTQALYAARRAVFAERRAAE